jgi:hypothetical protein
MQPVAGPISSSSALDGVVISSEKVSAKPSKGFNLARICKLAASTGLVVGVAVLATPVALGAAAGAALGSGLGWLGETIRHLGTLGMGSYPGATAKAMKKGAAGGAAVGGVVALAATVPTAVPWLIAGGVTGVGLAKLGDQVNERLNPLNWF